MIYQDMSINHFLSAKNGTATVKIEVEAVAIASDPIKKISGFSQ